MLFFAEVMDAPDVALHVDNAYFGSQTNKHSTEKNGNTLTLFILLIVVFIY